MIPAFTPYTPRPTLSLLLRLPSLLLLLYLAWFYRENSERRPREDREGVRRNALRVKHPKCPHTEEIMRTQNGATLAVTQPNGCRVVPYRVGTTAYSVMFGMNFLKIAFLKRLTCFPKQLSAFLKRLTKVLKTFTTFLKQFTLYTPFVFSTKIVNNRHKMPFSHKNALFLHFS